MGPRAPYFLAVVLLIFLGHDSTAVPSSAVDEGPFAFPHAGSASSSSAGTSAAASLASPGAARGPRGAQESDGVESVPGISQPNRAGGRGVTTWFNRDLLPEPFTCEKRPMVTQQEYPYHPLHPLISPNGTFYIVGVFMVISTLMNSDSFGPYPGRAIVPTMMVSDDWGLSWRCSGIPEGVARWYSASVFFTIPSFQHDPLTGLRKTQPLPGGKSCEVMCVIGGLVEPDGLPGTPTDAVTCSADMGVTWFAASRLPVRIHRATAFQVENSILVVGGKREDNSSDILRSVFDVDTCNITAWEIVGGPSPPPFAGHFDLAASGVWDNVTGTLKVWVGIGKTGSTYATQVRSYDVWWTSNLSDPLGWTVLVESAPRGYANAIVEKHEPTVTLFDLRAADGRPVSITYGACVPELASELGSCYHAIYLDNGNGAYILSPALGQRFVLKILGSLYTSGVPGSHINDVYPLTRLAKFFVPPQYPSIPLGLSFDIYSGRPLLSSLETCWDICPDRWFTEGCSYSPFDAVCKPCSVCRPGTFAAEDCRSSSWQYGDTVCRPCLECSDNEMKVYECNATHNTLCVATVPIAPSAIRVAAGLTHDIYGVVGTLFASVGFAWLALAARKGPCNEEAVSKAGGRVAAFRGGCYKIMTREWSLAFSVMQPVCYMALSGLLLTSDGRLFNEGIAIASFVVATIVFNSYFLLHVLRGSPSADASDPARYAWHPASRGARVRAVVALLHPRALLRTVSLTMSMHAIAAQAGFAPALAQADAVSKRGRGDVRTGKTWGADASSASASAPDVSASPAATGTRSSLVFADVLQWMLVTCALWDVAPLAVCISVMGEVGGTVLVPGVVACIVVGFVGLAVTLAWVATATSRISAHSKLLSKHMAHIASRKETEVGGTQHANEEDDVENVLARATATRPGVVVVAPGASRVVTSSGARLASEVAGGPAVIKCDNPIQAMRNIEEALAGADGASLAEASAALARLQHAVSSRLALAAAAKRNDPADSALIEEEVTASLSGTPPASSTDDDGAPALVVQPPVRRAGAGLPALHSRSTLQSQGSGGLWGSVAVPRASEDAEVQLALDELIAGGEGIVVSNSSYSSDGVLAPTRPATRRPVDTRAVFSGVVSSSASAQDAESAGSEPIAINTTSTSGFTGGVASSSASAPGLHPPNAHLSSRSARVAAVSAAGSAAERRG
jgi:hypothetical protein